MPTRKRPTPIRKTEPSIIEFPAQQSYTPKVISTNATDLTLNNQLYGNNAVTSIPHPEPDTQRLTPRSLDDVDVLRAFVDQRIKQALDGYSENLYHCLDRSEAEIIEMGPAQFQALMRDVFKEDA